MAHDDLPKFFPVHDDPDEPNCAETAAAICAGFTSGRKIREEAAELPLRDDAEAIREFGHANFKTALREEIEIVFRSLVEKNRQYGNSALAPVRVFSKADPVEQLNVRMDDKLSRIAQAESDDDEDPEFDLLGYLLIKRVARRKAPHQEGVKRG